jgi:hypothetical protein
MQKVLLLRPWLDASRATSVLLALSVTLAIVFTTGCGSSGSSAPVLKGNTAVTVLLSSTANSQLSQFSTSFNSISLTSQSGKTVNLFTTSQNPEFIHLNGKVEPLLTVTVPQDIYTSATASIGLAEFICATLNPSTGGIVVAIYGYGHVPDAQVTVNLPAPITVTGTAMGLSLNMLVSPSASFPTTCYENGIAQFSINPTFNLTPVPLSPPVAASMLDGRITSLNPADNSFTLVLPGGVTVADGPWDGQMLSVKTNNSTVYQGINGFSLLTVGTFVDMDAAIQADGSQLATRIAVQDTDTTNLSASTGPLLQTNSTEPLLAQFQRQTEGYLRTSKQASIFEYYNFISTTFQISERFANLHDLPFPATFDGSNIFAGQNVYITTHATQIVPTWPYIAATTMTLMPQTINGTINAVSSNGGFTTYDVTLASYDLIPTLAVQPEQTTVLTNPSNVVVYADSHTKRLNTQSLAVGSVVRFNGLLFNDNGTLRMDCDQLNDGVSTQQAGVQPAVADRGLHLTQRGIVVQRYLQHPDSSK